MRSQPVLCAVVLLICAVSAWGAEPGPAPALGLLPVDTNQFAMSGGVLMKQKMNTGEAADAEYTHYFTRNLGFTADADLLRSNYQAFREYGYRFGPTYRFIPNQRVQLFPRALFGYARFKSGLTGPRRPYQDGFSYALGGGADIWLTGPWSARVTGDFEDCVDSFGAANPTRFLRVEFGFKYSFGSQPSY